MAPDALLPETRVLAVASHVVHGYVGNKMATFVMQSFGIDVCAINTVHYSNHTAYKQVRGTSTSAAQIHDLYQGLQDAHLNAFDILLTGYMPSAEVVRAVGMIGRDIKCNAGTKPGSFFWVLDPVMGDNGKLYIPEDEVPEYKAILREADLILPNQFEAELLSDTTITDLASLAAAIQVLHKVYHVPHVIITSLRLSRDAQLPPRVAEEASDRITVIGSTATSDHQPRLFRIDTPLLPYFFSGTGDMFAALTIPRLIEAVDNASTPDLQSQPSWRSPDDIAAEDLPLAKACEKVLASMHCVLSKTSEVCEQKMKAYDERAEKEGYGQGKVAEKERMQRRHLALMNACEVQVVRHVKDMVDPLHVETFRAERLET